MKKIGQGWQYTTYDLGNGRVLKRYNSWIVACWSMLKSRHARPWKIPRFIRVTKQRAKNSFAKLQSGGVQLQRFGNPRFLNGLHYEQDIAIPLGDLFGKNTFEENMALVERFISLNRELSKAGSVDRDFNIANNYGLNTNGEMILFDIGELTTSADEVRTQCQKRIWAHTYVAGAIKDKKLREYFIEAMNKNFGLSAEI